MRRSTGSGSHKKSPPPTETEQRNHLFLDPSKPQYHHNHAIPCDSLLHKIATSLLPSPQQEHSQVSNEPLRSSKEKELESLRPHQRAAVLAATSSTSSTTSTVSPANNSTSQHETNPQSTASPWTQVVQSILWKEFGTLQDETATNTSTSNANSNSATNSKKRKKKKKKKKVTATESIHEEEQPTDSPTTETADTSTKDALEDESPKSSEQPTTEPNQSSSSSSPKNNNSSSPPLDFSVLPQDCPKVFPHYRDWWIHFYLDRANRQQNNNPNSNSSHDPDLSEFLQVIAQKTRIAHSETTTTNNNNNPPSSKKNKKSKGASATALSSSKPWFVPHAAVDEAINDIQCFHCRKAVRNLINSVTCLPLQALDQYRLSGGYRHYPANHFANVHTSNTFVDDNPEPFDYVAMEEGNAVVQNETSPPLVSDPASDIWALVAVPNEQTGETQGWRLQKVPKDVTTTSQPRLETLTITEADFTFLIRECYLLPAISYDMWVGAQPFTNEHDSRKDEEGQELYQAIIDKVQERHQDIMTNNNITPNRTKCLELFHKLANVPYPTEGEMQKRETADTKATVMLNDVNAETTTIVNSMLQLLLQLTRAYQSILTHWNYYHAQQLSSESNTATPPWLPFPSYLLKQVSTIVALWKTYLKCMQIMMDAVHDYEQAIFELADGRGTIKQIMFNPQMRRLLHNQLEIKLNACLEMIDEIRVQLDEQKDAYETPHFVYKPTFLRSILTQQAFLEVVVGNTAKYKNTELVGMNDACEDVLTELGQSWGFSEHRRNVTDFHEWHGQRRARMQRQLNTASILLQVYHDKACVSDNDNLPVLSEFLAKIDEEVSMDEAEPILRKDLLSTIENMIRAWMVSSTKALPKETTKTANGEPASRPGMQLGPKKTPAPASQSKDDSTVPFIMPLQLIEWSACCHEAGPSKKILPGYCHAPDGSRRAANMLMAFMFDWLDDQFNEWQAEKAEQELLSGVDRMLEDDLATSGAPTGKKKSKKKKNKKVADTTSPDTTLVVSKGDDTSTDKGPDPKDGKTSDKDEDESAVVPIVTAEPLDGVTTTTITTTVVTTTTTITTTNHPKQGADTSAESLSKETVAHKSIQESTPPDVEESVAVTPETTDNTPAATKGKNKKKKKSKPTATTAAQPSKPAPAFVEETTTDTTKNPPRKQPKTKSGKKQVDTVMIQDGSNRIKARTFLFQRMEANFGKGDKNVDSDGYPMVHIS